MKYRILLLAALVCAILAAAVGGTLAGYTTETSYSISIQPAATSTPKQPMADIPAEEDTAQEEMQAEPQASPEASDSATAETDKPADDAPLQTSDKEV